MVSVTIRYIPGVLEAMRVNWNGVLYNIKAVLEESTRGRLLTLMCDTGLNAG